MPNVNFFKVVAKLPDSLQANGVYFVRVGKGFDFYLTNSSGTIIAYGINPPYAFKSVPTGNIPGVNLITGLIGGNFKDVTVTFDKAFLDVPERVKPTLRNSNGAASIAIIKSVTKTNCVIRVVNFESTTQSFFLDVEATL